MSAEAPLSFRQDPPVSRLRRLLPSLLLIALGDLCLLGAVLWYTSPELFLPNQEAKPAPDPAENQYLRMNIPGIFSTGDLAGDRLLVIDGEGGVKLQILGPRQALHSEKLLSWEGTKQGELSLLHLSDGSRAELRNRDTLVYWGDTYLRSR